ncbi:MAG: VWA domain-containing protein [Bosea sp. (in: a-proteobacteria)]|uniref:vWA domain-containing protein n=1 Tax=Bosea sp. (in: a-proteobacteria) TaxID=1871050 RepID=UPI002736DBBD|nr:VWA domain-containing protein [Bosea sp. (in: a-proteobacteria)]MDP3601398.1 VWA domain-containing protein [Bosea sp. (in: a-proteobacteria)]
MTGKLPENVAYFARALRIAGLRVGPGAVVEAVEALGEGALGGREDVYWALHAIFVKRHEDSAVYDQAFRLFWRRRNLIEKIMAQMSPVSPGADSAPQKEEAGALRAAEAFAPPKREEEAPVELTELTARLTVSDRETLKSRDFAQMSAAEIARAKKLIADLRLPDDLVATRRFESAARGARIDPRRTFRRSLRGGGGSIELAFRERAQVHPPIVALVDISGSMAEYSRIFLHFLHAVTEKRRRVHSFVFGTRLTNITRSLRARDPDEALALAGRAAPDWEGGTRISTALHAFNRVWSRRVLGGGAIVLLFTDGLERHLDGELPFEMDRLHRSCRQLVWLNPLLRFDGFEARASGIRAMLPHVDSFRPIHNLAAMADLCAALSPDVQRASDPRAWLRRAG